MTLSFKLIRNEMFIVEMCVRVYVRYRLSSQKAPTQKNPTKSSKKWDNQFRFATINDYEIRVIEIKLIFRTERFKFKEDKS